WVREMSHPPALSIASTPARSKRTARTPAGRIPAIWGFSAPNEPIVHLPLQMILSSPSACRASMDAPFPAIAFGPRDGGHLSLPAFGAGSLFSGCRTEARQDPDPEPRIRKPY